MWDTELEKSLDDRLKQHFRWDSRKHSTIETLFREKYEKIADSPLASYKSIFEFSKFPAKKNVWLSMWDT